jgi:hypothetical protein
MSRNPLTGLSGLQQGYGKRGDWRHQNWSQSPYGAKWFATRGQMSARDWLHYLRVAIPLRG